MAHRSTISQSAQIGVETVKGTLVPANKQLSSIRISPSIQAETDQFKSTGSKYSNLTVLNREWTEFGIEGKPTYDELVYLLSCIVATPVITVSGTTGHLFTHTPLTYAEDAVKSLSMEFGSAVLAERWAYGMLKEVGITFSRDAIDLSGSGFAMPIEDGITMTATPTALPMVPLLPGKLDFFLDSSAANLGNTKLLATKSIDWKFADRFDPAWFVNSAINGFGAHIEIDPTNELTLACEADAVGMGFLTQLRANTVKFLRITCTGPQIGAGPAIYSATFDFCVAVNAGTDLKDADGVFGSEWPLTVTHDPTWGKAFEVKIINSLTTL